MDSNIKIRRMQLGLSMGALAVKAGITRRQMEYLEKGDARHINLEIISKVATALECKVIDLLKKADVARIGACLAVFFLTSNIG
jgi:DNA-binding Xre family transcriptional regulator